MTSGVVAAGGNEGTGMVGSGADFGIFVGREELGIGVGAVEVVVVVVVIDATDTPVWASARRRFS